MLIRFKPKQFDKTAGLEMTSISQCHIQVKSCDDEGVCVRQKRGEWPRKSEMDGCDEKREDLLLIENPFNCCGLKACFPDNVDYN